MIIIIIIYLITGIFTLNTRYHILSKLRKIHFPKSFLKSISMHSNIFFFAIKSIRTELIFLLPKFNISCCTSITNRQREIVIQFKRKNVSTCFSLAFAFESNSSRFGIAQISSESYNVH